jgi:hypothetical protein
MKTENVTRFELIDHRRNSADYGRIFVAWDENLATKVSVQDDGKTLKVFITDRI